MICHFTVKTYTTKIGGDDKNVGCFLGENPPRLLALVCQWKSTYISMDALTSGFDDLSTETKLEYFR